MSHTPDLRIAVITGGPAAEAEVSRSSAAGVAAALRHTWQDVSVLELDEQLPARLLEGGFAVVFPVLHGPLGEDGTVQGFLEIAGLRYVGSGVLASACAMNKMVAKLIFRAAGIPVAPDVIVRGDEDIGTAVRRVEQSLPGKVVIKPVGQGSAVGVTFAVSQNEVARGLGEARAYGGTVLVEQHVVGAEVTCAVLETPEPEALGTIEVRTADGGWYDFRHRYAAGLSEHVIPAGISEAQNRRVMELAVAAHRALGCRDLSRADFVVAPACEPILLEVNTVPGMTPTSLFPDAARSRGYDFPALVKHLIERAAGR